MREIADLTRRVSPPFSSAVCQLRNADAIDVNPATSKEPENVVLSPSLSTLRGSWCTRMQQCRAPAVPNLFPAFPQTSALLFGSRTQLIKQVILP